MAAVLSGYTRTCVISFIDLYEKVRRNFPQVKSVPLTERETLGKAFVEIGKKYGMMIRPCAEGTALARYGADCSGCMTQRIFEAALHRPLRLPPQKPARLQYLRSRLPILLRQRQPCDCSAEYAYARPRFSLFGRAQPAGRCNPRGKTGKLAGRSDQYG